MSGRITRREALIGSMLAIPALSLPTPSAFAVPSARVALDTAFKGLEEKTGARLGVAALDTDSDSKIEYRAHEHFAMCSTFKFLAAAAVLARIDRNAVLARIDRNEEQLDRIITYKKSELVPYSPATEKHVDTGMALGAICEAAVTLSDNTAGNLMLDNIGDRRD